MSAVTAIVVVALAWIVLSILFFGIGLWTGSVLGVRLRGGDDVFLILWLGWATTLLFLQLWHLALPVDGRSLLVLGVVSALGLLAHRRVLTKLPTPGARYSVMIAVAGGLAALWLANHTTDQPANGDSWAYHLMAVRWARSYPVLPGLGHLYNRLAFNSSFVLYTALLDVGPFAYKYHQLASGLLILWTIWKAMYSMARLVGGPTRFSLPLLYDALWLAPALALAMNGLYVSSPTPDIGVLGLGIVIGSLLFRFMDDAGLGRGRQEGARRAEAGLPILFLSVVGVTLKLSFAAFAACAGVAVLVVVWRTEGASRFLRLVLLSAVLAIVAALPWLARSVILSGYLAFPAGIGPMDVDWRISRDMAENEARWVKSWARMPNAKQHETLGTWLWLWPWLNRMFRDCRFDLVLPLFLAAVGPGLTCGPRRSRPAVTTNVAFWFMLTFVPALVFWFLTAPEPRFGGALFWTLGIAGSVWLLGSVEQRRVPRLAIFLSAILLVGHVNLVESFDRWRKDAGPLRSAPMKEMRTDSGLLLYIPVDRANGCWDGPLPCTPNFKPDLRLRVRGDFRSGFTRMPAVPAEAE